MLKVKGIAVRRHVVESLAMLEGENAMTVKQVAAREGVSPAAISARRRRLERKLGQQLPRHEKRGRKPATLAAA